ncbi:RING finger protein [Endozoicomonas sp. 8E]|uniref:RING finger protein n=1 Tax=Endozoicomonas sp. 8E TaxID=3035692 RepID=UPI0029393AA5|nr:RING finger protein [Endozoicomonas sp. 8E]WOG29215.1 RING finger protein [Endozoicomonas sp. 8E]
MTLPCALKTLLFSVFLFFYQQGLANDTYDLEGFRQHQKENCKPPLKKQGCTPTISPLENIRIGFVRLNLASEDVSGDGRLEICENYEVAEQDFKRLNNFYFNYVGMGDPLFRKVRIQTILRLIHRIFAMNINITNGRSRAEKKQINEVAESLFEQFFSSVDINGGSNPYFNYFYLIPGAAQSNYVDVNNGLVLMFLAFLGPHFLYKDQLYTCFCMLANIYTGQSYDRAFDSALLSENINEYNCPQSLANQLNAAGLDAETALLIGLTAMASAAFQRMNSGLASLETLETVLIRCLPYELLAIVYRNIASRCRSGRSFHVPGAMYTLGGMQAFTYGVVGIYPRPALPQSYPSENLDFLVDYSEYSDSEVTVEEPESEDEEQDQSIVIKQQNELIAELRQELASQPATEEAGAVGGASGETKKCPLCTDPLADIIVLQSCGHAGFCKNCAERLIRERRECPFCREIPLSYFRVIDMSLH